MGAVRFWMALNVGLYSVGSNNSLRSLKNSVMKKRVLYWKDTADCR